MRTPGPAALFRIPLPLLGAEVAPKAPALFPPAPGELSTLEFRFKSLRSGGKTAGAGGAAALTAFAITAFGTIGALNGAVALVGAADGTGAGALADPGAVMEAMDGREARLGLVMLPLLLL